MAAARTVLETAIKAIELEDLEQRIVALEMQQGIRRVDFVTRVARLENHLRMGESSQAVVGSVLMSLRTCPSISTAMCG